MVAVHRVLPWRRRPQSEVSETSTLLTVFHENHPNQDSTLIEKAYQLALKAHEGQTRKSGEPYIHHPLAVATIVAKQGLDDVTIAAALLHDAVEDTKIEISHLEEEFGSEVALIVDGVTKLDRLNFDSKEEQQAASMRKMLVALAKDLRVLIIKLADRLHNMRTLAALPEFKQERTARETLDIYAPLAHRLGMEEVKVQLEDLSLATLYPKRYSEIDQMVSAEAPERDLYLTQMVGEVESRFKELGIEAEVDGRPKHLWSIYEKMIVKGRSFEEIHDLVGIRVLVQNVRDCYAALGSIHAVWKPVQGRFKDYVAMPKFNLYQSLHTTVIGPQGKQVEFQIRTYDMHRRAEYGVAAHWDYKGVAPVDEMTWLSRIVEWQEETTDPSRFMANLKMDLEQDEIFLFTPEGKVIALPIGATTVDFAYAIHTEVGHSCVGARVDGRLVPLETRLNSGSTVEIVTSKQPGAGPSQDWLKFVVSHRAENRIRHWFSRERRAEAVERGHEELVEELRRANLPIKKTIESEMFSEISASLNYLEIESLYAAIGEGNLSPKSLITRVERSIQASDPEQAQNASFNVLRARPNRRTQDEVGVHVEGLGDLLVRLSRCCTPVPPDQIMGFVTRGRGVTVHRTDCANAVSLSADQPDRLIDVEWDQQAETSFVASIEVKALDRPLLLRDLVNVLADHQINVLGASTITSEDDRVARLKFDFELGDPNHLDPIMRIMRGIHSVYDVYRIVPGANS